MAKGDHSRGQNAIDSSTGMAQNNWNNVWNNQLPQNQQLQNRFNVAADQANTDYSNIKGNYNDYINRAYNPATFGALPMYQNFAQTGGFSPEDIAAMRARGEGAVRSVFDSANRNLEQQNRIQGGSSTARTAALAKVGRDTSQGVADADTSLEAQLADSIRQGKLSGMAGMTNINQAQMQDALAGMGGLNTAYGTTPGQANMYGNQLTQSNNQMINMQQLQDEISKMKMQGQLNLSQVPGDYQQALGNIGGTLNLGSKFFNIPNLFGGGGGMYSSPSTSYQPSDQFGWG